MKYKTKERLKCLCGENLIEKKIKQIEIYVCKYCYNIYLKKEYR